MWFAWDGSRIRLTHTSTRQKFANLAHEPRVALSIADPGDQYRFLEIRGTVQSIEDDPGAEFHRSLQRGYGTDDPTSTPTSGWSSPSGPTGSSPFAVGPSWAPRPDLSGGRDRPLKRLRG